MTVARDRVNYSDALSDSWKQQNLLNIVKLRYADPPIFMDVGQIVSGYTLEAQSTAASGFTTFPHVNGTPFTINGNVHYTDRPTITYSPLTGQNFVKAIMTPIPPHSILAMVQSGWRADVVFMLAVDQINGLRNRSAGAGRMRAGDPEYYKLLALLRKIQESGAVGMRLLPGTAADTGKKSDSLVLFFRQKEADEEITQAIIEVKKLLRLKADASEYKVIYGAASGDGSEIAFVTRSMLHIMFELADNIQVPDADLKDKRVLPTIPLAEGAPPPLIHIYSGLMAPADAFVKVNYRGMSFWIDDKDIRSKGTFAFLMLMFSLADTGNKEGLLLTIPTQ
jgi:hypothetical protein